MRSGFATRQQLVKSALVGLLLLLVLVFRSEGVDSSVLPVKGNANAILVPLFVVLCSFPR